MKWMVAIVCAMAANVCLAQAADNFRPASTNVWGAQYPRVDDAGRVQVRVKAPEATAVRLNFWNGPKVEMQKQSDGFWTVMTEPLVPGLHYYPVVVDGADVADPGSHSRAARELECRRHRACLRGGARHGPRMADLEARLE